MATSIDRYFSYKPLRQVALQTTLAATPDIALESYVAIGIYLKKQTVITKLTFYVAPRAKEREDTLAPAGAPQPLPNYYQLFNAQGLPVTLTVTGIPSGSADANSSGNAYDLTGLLTVPGAVMPYGSLKIVVDAADNVELSFKA